MYCGQCGKKIKDGDLYCCKCGNKLDEVMEKDEIIDKEDVVKRELNFKLMPGIMNDRKNSRLIIFLLLMVILLVTLVVTQLNNGKLGDSTDLSQVSSNKKEDTKALNDNNYFYEVRSEREQQESTDIQSLNSIISDANTSKEKKDAATKELTQKTMVRDNEGRVELSIKNKGYEDAFCRIDSNKATVIVKAPNGLKENETVAIQKIVQDLTKIKDVIIEVHK